MLCTNIGGYQHLNAEYEFKTVKRGADILILVPLPACRCCENMRLLHKLLSVIHVNSLPRC